MTGHGFLARMRSYKKLRTTNPSVGDIDEQYAKNRQNSAPAAVLTMAPPSQPRPSTSSSSSRPSTSSPRRCSSSAGHAPHQNLEWDPLALNPLPQNSSSKQQYHCHQHHAASLHDLQRPLRTKRSFAGHEHSHRANSIVPASPTTVTARKQYHTSRPRLHHSESGLSLASHKDFDFGSERQKAIERLLEQNRQAVTEADLQTRQQQQHAQQCPPSPTATDVSSPSTPTEEDLPELWHDGDYEVAVAIPLHTKNIKPRNIVTSASNVSSEDVWEHGDFTTPLSASPRRRLPLGNPSDGDFFMKRGGWKRRGIVFGGGDRDEGEVFVDEDQAFDLN